MLQRLIRDGKAHVKAISPEALEVLQKYDWPGNVRELENLIYRSAVMAQETILIKDPGVNLPYLYGFLSAIMGII